MRNKSLFFDIGATDRTGRAFSALQGRLSAAEKRANGFGKTFSLALAGATRAIAPLGIAVAGALGGRALISGIAEFDSAMSKAAAVTRATGQALEDMREVSTRLGESTEFSAAQAAEGLTFLGMAGFSAAESVSALPQVLDLATASGMGLGQAADTASNIMSAFGIAAKNAANVTDVLAAASTRANTDVSQLGQAISTAGPIASTLGIALEDTAAAIGVMSDAGIQGERAGTALRGVLASLSGPTSQAEKALAAYGLTVDDVNPATRSLADIMDTLARAGLSTADAMQIFGREAASGALVMIQASDRLREFGGELRNVDGAAGDMAATMRDNLRGDLQGASSAVQGLIIALGDAGLTSVLRSVVQVVTGFVRGLSLIVGQVGDAIGAINRLFSAQARVEAQIDNTRTAINDELKALANLEPAMAGGMSMSTDMANRKLAEAMSRRTNIQAIIDEQRALGMATSEYKGLSQEIDYLQLQSENLRNTGRDGGPFAPSANRADIEWQTREIARLAEERQRLLDPGGDAVQALRENDEAIRKLRDGIDDANSGLVVFNNTATETVDATDRLSTEINEIGSGGGRTAIQGLTDDLEALKTASFDLNASLAGVFTDALTGVKSLTDGVRDLLKQMASMFLNKAFSNILGNIFPSLSGINFGGGRERGGPVSAGTAYVVGEKRPELFVPRTSGGIIPRVPMGGGGGGTVVQVINNTGQPSRQERQTLPDGRQIVRTIIGEEVGNGGIDRQMNGRFGLTPSAVRR